GGGARRPAAVPPPQERAAAVAPGGELRGNREQATEQPGTTGHGGRTSCSRVPGERGFGGGRAAAPGGWSSTVTRVCASRGRGQPGGLGNLPAAGLKCERRRDGGRPWG